MNIEKLRDRLLKDVEHFEKEFSKLRSRIDGEAKKGRTVIYNQCELDTLSSISEYIYYLIDVIDGKETAKCYKDIR